ncbi:MAG: hypothetical protein DMG54_19585 [Acidobacteria bacterium]|nr:MAG: hypothetical protein DMG54_19585 [Acidobacteriota bacterium]PYU73087.1 MAG: hypothetical protein DMG52_16390 [Acidobacteriota bacterium]
MSGIRASSEPLRTGKFLFHPTGQYGLDSTSSGLPAAEKRGVHLQPAVQMFAGVQHGGLFAHARANSL